MYISEVIMYVQEANQKEYRRAQNLPKYYVRKLSLRRSGIINVSNAVFPSHPHHHYPSHYGCIHPVSSRLLILRLTTLRILLLLMVSLIPTLRSSLHGYLLPSAAALHHVLHVWPVPQVLVEAADVATDVFVWFETKGYHGYETEREPFPAFVHARAEVAAVLALRSDVLVAFEKGLEGWRVRSDYVSSNATGVRLTVRATREDECHPGSAVATKR